MTRPDRPGILTAGILLTGLHAVLFAGFWMCLSLATIGLSGFAALSIAPPALFPIGLVASLGAGIMLLMATFYVGVVVVCAKAWGGSRPWLWGLIVLACIGLVSTGPISMVINVLTIIGAIQWLDVLPREREVARA